MFYLNVSKSSGEADDEGSPTRLGLKVPHLTQCFPYQVVTGKIYHLILEQHFWPPAMALRFLTCDKEMNEYMEKYLRMEKY